MRKRIISLLLVLVMVFTMLPTAVFADDLPQMTITYNAKCYSESTINEMWNSNRVTVDMAYGNVVITNTAIVQTNGDGDRVLNVLTNGRTDLELILTGSSGEHYIHFKSPENLDDCYERIVFQDLKMYDGQPANELDQAYPRVRFDAPVTVMLSGTNEIYGWTSDTSRGAGAAMYVGDQNNGADVTLYGALGKNNSLFLYGGRIAGYTACALYVGKDSTLTLYEDQEYLNGQSGSPEYVGDDSFCTGDLSVNVYAHSMQTGNTAIVGYTNGTIELAKTVSMRIVGRSRNETDIMNAVPIRVRPMRNDPTTGASYGTVLTDHLSGSRTVYITDSTFTNHSGASNLTFSNEKLENRTLTIQDHTGKTVETIKAVSYEEVSLKGKSGMPDRYLLSWARISGQGDLRKAGDNQNAYFIVGNGDATLRPVPHDNYKVTVSSSNMAKDISPAAPDGLGYLEGDKLAVVVGDGEFDTTKDKYFTGWSVDGPGELTELNTGIAEFIVGKGSARITANYETKPKVTIRTAAGETTAWYMPNKATITLPAPALPEGRYLANWRVYPGNQYLYSKTYPADTKTITLENPQWGDTYVVEAIYGYSNKPVSMEVISQPKKLHYTAGEPLDMTGLAVKLTYADGKTEVCTYGTDSWKDLSRGDLAENWNGFTNSQGYTAAASLSHDGNPFSVQYYFGTVFGDLAKLMEELQNGVDTLVATTEPLTVDSPPSAPRNVKAVMSGKDTVTITWDVPMTDGNSPITGYQISVDGGTTWKYTTSANATSYVVTVNDPMSVKFSVRAENKYGTSSYNSIVSASNPRTDVRILTQPKLSYPVGAEMDWSDLVLEVTYGDTSKDTVTDYVPTLDDYYQGKVLLREDSGNRITLTYQGFSVTTNALNVYTTPGAPILTKCEGGEGTLLVEWTAPADDGGSAITGYFYRVDGLEWHPVTTGTSLSIPAEINIPCPIELRAANEAGYGEIVRGAGTPYAIYTVDFAPGDGSGEMASVTVKSTEPFSLPECTFTAPEGMMFDYWRSTVGHMLTPGFPLTVTEDMTLTAIWAQQPPLVNGVYEIDTLLDLRWFAEQVNSGNTDINARLTMGLFGSHTTHIPIGTQEHPYTGTFDGQGFVIDLMTIDSSKGYQGIFGAVAAGAVIKNLTVRNCVFTGGDFTAALVGGSVRGTSGTVTIENCISENNTINGGMHTGSIFGGNTGADATVILRNCGVFDGSVAGTSLSGGLAGYVGNASRPCVIENCWNSASITVENQDRFGDSFAHLDAATISNCYNLDTLPASEKKGVSTFTEEALANGALAYKLGAPWGQTIDANQYPVLNGKTVYCGYLSCAADAEMVYTNDSSISAEKPAHTGGTATCTEQAICGTCGEHYGETFGDHLDENLDHICDRNCGVTDIGEHSDSADDKDHVCDYGCGEILEDHMDENNDHICDRDCGYVSKHVFDESGKCSICQLQNYGIWIGGVEVTSQNLSGEGWSYTPNDNTLTLDNANIGGIQTEHKLTIALKGANKVNGEGTNRQSIGMNIGNEARIIGDGTLTVWRGDDAGYPISALSLILENLVVTEPEGGYAGSDFIYDATGSKNIDHATLVPLRVRKVEMTSPPTKTLYFPGETFDPTGMEITVFYNNGTTKVIDDIAEACTWDTEALTESKILEIRHTETGRDFEVYVTVINLWAGHTQFTRDLRTIPGDTGTASLSIGGTESNPEFTVTLDNFTYKGTGHEGTALYFDTDAGSLDPDPLKLILKGENVISGKNFGMDIAHMDTTVEGEGSLDITGGMIGMCATGGFTMNSGTIKGTGIVGVMLQHLVTLNGGTLSGYGTTSEEMYSAGVYLYYAGTFIVNGGTLIGVGGDQTGQESHGILVDGPLEIHGGTVSGTGGKSNVSSYGIKTDGDITTITGGDVTAYGQTQAFNKLPSATSYANGQVWFGENESAANLYGQGTAPGEAGEYHLNPYVHIGLPQAHTHTGGTATCQTQAVCELCKQPYGDKNPENHAQEGGYTHVDVELHTVTYSCCGASTEEYHTFEEGICACSQKMIITLTSGKNDDTDNCPLEIIDPPAYYGEELKVRITPIKGSVVQINKVHSYGTPIEYWFNSTDNILTISAENAIYQKIEISATAYRVTTIMLNGGSLTEEAKEILADDGWNYTSYYVEMLIPVYMEAIPVSEVLPMFTRDGYTAAGISYQGQIYGPGDSIPVDLIDGQNLDLVWASSGPATVTLQFNGGTPLAEIIELFEQQGWEYDDNQVMISVDASEGNLPVNEFLSICTREGYTAIGLLDTTGKLYVANEVIPVTDGMILKLLWEEEDAYGLLVGDTAVDETNANDILGDRTASYDLATRTLTLNNANINKYGIQSYYDLNLVLLGENTIVEGWILAAMDDFSQTYALTISGPGSLTADAVVDTAVIAAKTIELNGLTITEPADARIETVTEGSLTVSTIVDTNGNYVTKVTLANVDPDAPVLQSIAITTQPSKTIYVPGELFDPTGMVVTASYADGTSKEVSGYTWTEPSDLYEAAPPVVTQIRYTENGVTVTADLPIELDLPAPTNLRWSGTYAEWDTVPAVEEYVVRLLHNGETVGSGVYDYNAAGWCDMYQEMRELFWSEGISEFSFQVRSRHGIYRSAPAVCEETYTFTPHIYVAGTISDWGISGSNRMTLNDGVCSKTFTDMAPGYYELKVYEDGEWYGDFMDANLYFTVTETCDVTVTYDGTGDGGVTVSGEHLTDTNNVVVAGNGWVNNNASWDTKDLSNAMTMVEKGVYEITYKNVSAGTHEFKFAIDTTLQGNEGWKYNYGGTAGNGSFHHLDSDGSNIQITLTEESNVTITLAFVDEGYAVIAYGKYVTTPANVETYTVTVENGTGSGSYEEGQTVTITANEAEEGKIFTGWTSDDVTFADSTAMETTFTMPAKDVTVTANYKDAVFYTLNLESPRGLRETVKISTDATVGELKDAVAALCGVTFGDDSEYRLFGEDLQYPNSSLSDDTKVLQDIGFANDQTIHLEKSTHWDAATEPIKIFGLTITGGKGSQEPYGDYTNVDYYWNYYYKTITIRSEADLTISGTGEMNTNIIIKSAGSNKYTNLTISDLHLTTDGGACINVQGNSWVNLTINGTNTLTMTGENAPYMVDQVPALTLTNSGAYLKIRKASTGTLTATTNVEGQPGIGTYDNTSTTWGLEVNGGTIIANGGPGAAGIRADAICILGGNVTANGGIHAYGSGNDVYPDPLKISGGTVTAISDTQAVNPAPVLDGYDYYTATAGDSAESAVTYDSAAYASYKYFHIEPAAAPSYTFQQSTQLGLIEPWFLKSNLYVSTNGGESYLSADALEALDYGVYFVRKSDVADGSVETIVSSDKAIHLYKGNGASTESGDLGGKISASFTEGIYTYQLADPVYVLFYVKDENGVHYDQVKERDLIELANKGMADDRFDETERNVYTSMLKLYNATKAHRDTFETIPEMPEMTAKTLTAGMFNGYAADLTVQHSNQIVLIEPWGIQFNGYVTGEYEDYGLVVSTTATTLDELVNDENALVFSVKDGSAQISGNKVSGLYTKDIYTYQLDKNLFVAFYGKDESGRCHFGNVMTRNILNIVSGLITNTSFAATERNVYSAMVDMYEDVTTHRAKFVN